MASEKKSHPKIYAICVQVAFFCPSVFAAETGVIEPVAISKPPPKTVSKQAASFETKEVEAVTFAKPVRSAGANDERLQILNKERLAIVQKLESAQTEPQEARHRADLDAIDREISGVSKTPVTKAASPKNIANAVKTAGATMPAEKIAASPSPVTVSFESWDIFKNFGSKETK